MNTINVAKSVKELLLSRQAIRPMRLESVKCIAGLLCGRPRPPSRAQDFSAFTLEPAGSALDGSRCEDDSIIFFQAGRHWPTGGACPHICLE